MTSLDEDDNVSLGEMSDEELQEAFAAGILKPGLNVRVEEKVYKNNVEGLREKLNELSSNLNWIERLDLEVQPAPIAPELHFQVNEKEKENIVNLKSRPRFPTKQKDQVALDDFKREVLFHRQAQSAVLQGIPRLKSMKIPTQRPDDYFAEMMKSDEHMQKIRQNLQAKQTGAKMAERVSQLRKLKKLGKQIQIQNQLKQLSEKKKILEEVKKYRKGIRKDLDFLDTKKSKGPGTSKKQKMKNEKYGFGGKKKGSKRNTKDSTSSLGSSVKKGKGKNNNKRLGRSKRLKKKSKK